jgi:glycosyltransferase involved in cell wall biosynthesis
VQAEDPDVDATVAVLKHNSYSEWKPVRARGAAAGSLGPYSVDLLEDHGFRVLFTDSVFERPWTAPLVERSLGWLGRRYPELQGARNALANRGLIARSDITLGVFEDQGSFAAFARGRRVPLLAPRLMALVVCWMAERAQHADSRTLRGFRRVLDGADLVVFFSKNQAPIFEGLLGLDPARMLFVPFGIDAQFFAQTKPREDGYVVAIGGDSSRDHELLVEAVRGTPIPTRIYAPKLESSDLPANVRWTSEVIDHVTYRDVLAGATLVVVPTRGTTYPGGQTVLLEAMASTKPVITTRTDAMLDYVADGLTGMLVPPGDVGAMRLTIQRLLEDPALRSSLGAKARAAVETRFNQAAMWADIGRGLHAVLDGRRGAGRSASAHTGTP